MKFDIQQAQFFLQQTAIIEKKVMVAMRDGVQLCTDIYRPKKTEKVPIIFVRTPDGHNYRMDSKFSIFYLFGALQAVSKGYAFVVQSERGRYHSEGDWQVLGLPLTDAEVTFDWLAQQDWTNGKIMTTGCSSTAEWQLAVAALNHPAHITMVAAAYGAGIGKVGRFQEQGNWYRGGVHQMLFTTWLYKQQALNRNQTPYQEPNWSEVLYHLPLKDMLSNLGQSNSIFEDRISRKPNDPKWLEEGHYQATMPFDKPALWWVSWFDVSASPNLELYNHIRENAVSQLARDNQYLVIAPVKHCAFLMATENTMIGDLNVGDARFDYETLEFEWNDYWLKGKDSDYIKQLPRVQYYTMGLNKWQSAESWSPKDVQLKTFYLSSKKGANTLHGDGLLSPNLLDNEGFDAFDYNPLNPVPSHGGNVCCIESVIKSGSYDQRIIEEREDVLVYTTPILEEGIEVTGFIEATLYVSSNVKDTDFTIKLIDVYPDGRAFNLDETIQRVRYRKGYDQVIFMEEGEVYELSFSPLSTSNYFAKGHAIRIEVSSSNFPRFNRNLNTGGNNYDETESLVAHNKVHFSGDYRSQIRLPIRCL